MCQNYPNSKFVPVAKKIERSDEYVIIGKNIDKNYPKIKNEIRKIHSYKIPCILKIKIDEVNKDKLSWLNEALK